MENKEEDNVQKSNNNQTIKKNRKKANQRKKKAPSSSMPLAQSSSFPPAPTAQEAGKKQLKTVSDIAKTLEEGDKFIGSSALPAGYPVFPVSNEKDPEASIKQLPEIKFDASTSKGVTEKTRAAFVIGECHLNSFYPEFEKQGIKLLIQADFSPIQIESFRHSRQCLLASKDPEDFEKTYFTDNPLEKADKFSTQRFAYSRTDMTKKERLKEIIKHAREELLPHYHFLGSPARYEACQKAAGNLAFAAVKIDLRAPDKCYNFLKYLQRNNVEIVLFNFSNVWHQPRASASEPSHDTYNVLSSIYILTSFSTSPTIFYSENTYNSTSDKTKQKNIQDWQSQICFDLKTLMASVANNTLFAANNASPLGSSFFNLFGIQNIGLGATNVGLDVYQPAPLRVRNQCSQFFSSHITKLQQIHQNDPLLEELREKIPTVLNEKEEEKSKLLPKPKSGS